MDALFYWFLDAVVVFRAELMMRQHISHLTSCEVRVLELITLNARKETPKRSLFLFPLHGLKCFAVSQ